MSIKSYSIAFILGCLLAAGSFAQDSEIKPTAEASIKLASFVQDKEKSDNDKELWEEFEKLKLRLGELEDDHVELSKSSKSNDGDSEKTVDSISETLEDLGETVDSLDKSVEKVKDTLPGLVYHGHKKPKLSFFGRIHLDYWAFPKAQAGIVALEGEDPQDRFNFRRMRIGVKGNLTDNMLYKYEGEFAGGVDPSYRDAYIGWTDLPFLHTLLIGNQKRPYGLDHLNSSRYNVFIERPFIIEAINQDSRRLGLASYGHSEDLSRNWRFGVWNYRLTQTQSGYIGDHYQPEFASRRAWTPWYDECSGGRGYFHFGVAGSVAFPNGRGGGDNDAQFRTRPEARSSARWLDTGRIVGANVASLAAVETVFNYGPFQAVAEYQESNVDRTGAEDLNFHGGYFYVSYFLTGEHIPWERKSGTLGRMKPFENFFRVRDCDCNTHTGWGAWQVAMRYSYADFNDLDIVGGDGEAFTLGLNWHWNPYARWQFNYIIGDVKREPLGSGDYEIFGLRFMVDF